MSGKGEEERSRSIGLILAHYHHFSMDTHQLSLIILPGIFPREIYFLPGVS